MTRRKILGILCGAAAAAIAVFGAVSANSGPKYHYELSSDLRLVFSNSDSIIDTMRTAFVRRDQAIHIKYVANDGYMGDVSPLIHEILDCVFCETDNPNEGDYLKYQFGGYEMTYRNEENPDQSISSAAENSDGQSEDRVSCTYTLDIVPVYYTTPEQEQIVDEDIRRILGSMEFAADTTDAQKTRVIYEYVKDNVAYDSIHKSSNYHLKSTAYAALERGIAGCQGYAVLMYRLLREAGIDCRVVTGMASYRADDSSEGKSEYHAWNIVRLGDVYYNLDVTWCSRLGTDEYYMRGSDNFSDHVSDDEFQTDAFMSEYPLSRTDLESR